MQNFYQLLKTDAIRLRNEIDQCKDPDKKGRLIKRYAKLISLLESSNLQIEVIETSVEIVVIARRP